MNSSFFPYPEQHVVPPWLQPPEVEYPVRVVARELLAPTDGTSLSASHVDVYSTGVRIKEDWELHRRDESGTDWQMAAGPGHFYGSGGDPVLERRSRVIRLTQDACMPAFSYGAGQRCGRIDRDAASYKLLDTSRLSKNSECRLSRTNRPAPACGGEPTLSARGDCRRLERGSGRLAEFGQEASAPLADKTETDADERADAGTEPVTPGAE